MTVRTQLWLAVLGCTAGAGAVLFAAGREWAAAHQAGSGRSGPLSAQAAAHSGADLLPWLPALGWVALAGAGAVLATGPLVRRLLGGLLVTVGAVLAVGSGAAVVDPDRAVGWPVVAAAGGAVVVAAGAVTLLRGGGWPTMGVRYERRAGQPASGAQGPQGVHGAAPEAMWAALDRGEDPTVR